MQCNIDEHGARFRRVWGIMNLIVAVMMAALALWSGIWWLWVIAGVCGGAGCFAIWESRKKWCVLRAVGLKTRV